MTGEAVDTKTRDRIESLGCSVLEGNDISRADALWLFNLTATTDILDLMSWANRIRERHFGNRVHLCSIVNIKAGGCPENCQFCAQSALYQTNSPRYSLVDQEPVLAAADEAHSNGVKALGLVAAWRGLEEGPVLDDLCKCFEQMKKAGKARPDASLGMIKTQQVADRLRQAGVECYNHNLETSQRFFPSVCTTHTYDDRVRTIGFLQNAGITICSGGILGVGETREDRCDLAFSLKELGAQIVPMNFLNPIEGTPMGEREPLAPMEILHMIACFRFVLPRQDIKIAGGRVVNLRDLQSMIFFAGASGLMVGNYLTTLNQPVEKDLQMIKDLGLVPDTSH
jgi:biotin synthase